MNYLSDLQAKCSKLYTTLGALYFLQKESIFCFVFMKKSLNNVKDCLLIKYLNKFP